jgi:rod shape-determining protein MreC
LGIKTLILVAASAALMFFNYYSGIAVVRSGLSLIVVPIQYIVNSPIQFIHSLHTVVTSKNELLKENTRISAELLLLQAKVQRLSFLEHENDQLRTLLSTSKQFTEKVLAAQLLAVNIDNLNQQAVLDKGKKNNLYLGQPVLDAFGVIGQIIAIDLFTSRVLLITDPKSAVPVVDIRNGFQAIAVGIGFSKMLELVNIPETADLKVGDLFVTSGLGSHFPYGYPVGMVSSIHHDRGARFVTVLLKPSAHVNTSRYLLLLWLSADKRKKVIIN